MLSLVDWHVLCIFCLALFKSKSCLLLFFFFPLNCWCFSLHPHQNIQKYERIWREGSLTCATSPKAPGAYQQTQSSSFDLPFVWHSTLGEFIGSKVYLFNRSLIFVIILLLVKTIFRKQIIFWNLHVQNIETKQKGKIIESLPEFNAFQLLLVSIFI